MAISVYWILEALVHGLPLDLSVVNSTSIPILEVGMITAKFKGRLMDWSPITWTKSYSDSIGCMQKGQTGILEL